LGGDGPAGLSGVLHVVVLRIQSTSAVSPTTLNQLAAEVLAVDSRAREHSNNLLSLDNDKDNDANADVLNVVVNQSTAGLGEASAFTLCSQAKINAGVSGYDHYVCILPPDMNYSWYGQAYIGGNDMVINGNYASGYPNGLEHEMAHNWGRHHANTQTVEYGDSTCIMGGNAGTADRHFNGPQKLGLGWVSATDAGNGSHSLNAVEATTGTRLLKVHDPVANQDLYVSTRVRLGNYSSGPINPGTTQVHEWSGGSSRTYLLATLNTGQTFDQNGISITQTAHSGTSATVEISGAGNCTRAAPLLTVTPPRFTSDALQSHAFNLELRNQDTNCGSATFSLSSSSSSPSITGNLGSTSIVLASGGVGSTTLDAVPISSLAAGAHTLSILVTASNHSNVTGSAEYEYVPPTPTVTATTTAIASATPAVDPVTTPVATPVATPPLTPTATSPSNDRQAPTVNVERAKKFRSAVIVLSYAVSDDSNVTSDTIEILKGSRSLVRKQLPLSAIPARQRRTVSVRAATLPRGTYNYCVTAIDRAANTSKDCDRLVIR